MNIAAMSPKQRLVGAIGAGVVALVVPLTTYFEGASNKVYADPVGIATVCMGHTGSDVKPGTTYTQQQCEDILASDLYAHDADISKCIAVEKLTPGQHAAFLDFAFNVGAPKFCGSTMARKINAGDVMGACAELSRWVYAGGRELPGLVKRRAKERAVCEGRS